MATVKIFNKKISWDGLNLTCAMERYLNTNNLALELYDEEGEFYLVATLDSRQTLPKTNNAVIYNDKENAGILNALTKVNMVRVVGKIDVKLMIRDLVVVNTRQFEEVDEEVFLEFAKSSYTDLNEFLNKDNVKEETSEDVEVLETNEEVEVLDDLELDKKLEAILNDL
ncbi:MAG: hypothetical protein Q4B63_04530 [Clostridium perfringens]|nr:hypothetical protein [Clostridium perfringens]